MQDNFNITPVLKLGMRGGVSYKNVFIFKETINTEYNRSDHSIANKSGDSDFI